MSDLNIKCPLCALPVTIGHAEVIPRSPQCLNMTCPHCAQAFVCQRVEGGIAVGMLRLTSVDDTRRGTT